jgi:hypothetical protein
MYTYDKVSKKLDVLGFREHCLKGLKQSEDEIKSNKTVINRLTLQINKLCDEKKVLENNLEISDKKFNESQEKYNEVVNANTLGVTREQAATKRMQQQDFALKTSIVEHNKQTKLIETLKLENKELTDKLNRKLVKEPDVDDLINRLRAANVVNERQYGIIKECTKEITANKATIAKINIVNLGYKRFKPKLLECDNNLLTCKRHLISANIDLQGDERYHSSYNRQITVIDDLRKTILNLKKQITDLEEAAEKEAAEKEAAEKDEFDNLLNEYP